MGEFAGQRAVVMGLGRFGGGEGVARFLAERGADVLVTDMLDEAALAEPLARLSDLSIELRLGEHDARDFAAADVVVVNPAIDPRNNRYLAAARQGGAQLTSEIRLLVERLPNRRRTIGVTGTAGKSTTVAMIGHALRCACGDERVHVGGNIGGSLLPQIEHIGDDDWVVLELSSFMLETIGRWSPHIAVITNFSANHLDRHGTLEVYRDAKQVIFEHQREDEDDVAIGGPGVHDVFDNRVANYATWDDDHWQVSPPIDLLVPGRHNQLNARLASGVVEAAIGQPEWQTWEALGSFPGLPHRLQLVAERDGVRWFNDSKSTTPESAMLALDCFDKAVAHLIAGGYDKGSDLTEFAHHAAEHGKAVYTIGRTGDAIADAAEKLVEFEGHHCAVHRCGTLERAIDTLRAALAPGDVVLLSPGCAAWDQFDHFEHRGETFSRLAQLD